MTKYLFIIYLSALVACGGSNKILSSSEDTGLFIPPKIEAGVDMYVDEIDGKKVKFQLSDSAQVDAGSHDVVVRLEYQPASGTSIVVGSLGNLLLRSTTNKTFRTHMSIDVEKNHDYQFVVTSTNDGFDIALMDVSTTTQKMKHSFLLKDGEFERVF